MDDGWTDLQKMWDTKQSLFTQSNKLLVSVYCTVFESNALLEYKPRGSVAAIDVESMLLFL